MSQEGGQESRDDRKVEVKCLPPEDGVKFARKTSKQRLEQYTLTATHDDLLAFPAIIRMAGSREDKSHGSRLFASSELMNHVASATVIGIKNAASQNHSSDANGAAYLEEAVELLDLPPREGKVVGERGAEALLIMRSGGVAISLHQRQKSGLY